MSSIRYKFLAIIVSLIVGTMVSYLTLATRLYDADKEAYIYDSNASVAEAVSAQTETLLSGVAHSMSSIADFMTDPNFSVPERERLVTALFNADDSLVDLVIERQPLTGQAEPLFDISNRLYLELHEIDPPTLRGLTEEFKATITDIPDGKLSIRNALLAGGIPLLTVAVRMAPIEGRDGIFMVAQVQQDRLIKIFSQSQMHSVFLIDGYGNVLAHPDVAVVASKENVANPEFVTAILANPLKTGAKEFTDQNGVRWLTAFSKIDAGNLVAISKISRESAFAATRILIKKSLLFALGLVILAFVVSMVFSKSLTTPLKRLFEATKKIGAGDFSLQVVATTKDEVGSLATSFNAMAGKILTLLSEVRDKARMEKELETARVVQENLFPKNLHNEAGFSLAGFYVPASECGGDWWSYFKQGNRLYVLLGDATGHGVPAALITAAAQSCCTAIQEISRRVPAYKMTPGTIMRELNVAIHHAAKGGMNMTFFIAMIDLKSGGMVYANASHELPIVCRLVSGGPPEFNMLMGDPGPCLGESVDSVYPEHTLQLQPQDTVIWYTDGLVEVRNDQDEEWGERRFMKVLKANSDANPKKLVEALSTQSKTFYGSRPPDDDITYVIVRWLGAAVRT
jgi:sigma-B regulation protein RsbU (phosphoserine phosphatase)